MRAYRTIGPDHTVPWLPSSHHSRVLLACAPEACANVSADYTGPHTVPYTVGTQVRIVGLENATHLNGRVGWVTQFDEERGIVHVAFHSRDVCHSSQGPPLKLIARFVEHSVASEYTDASAEQHTSLPACVSASANPLDDEQEERRSRGAEIANEALSIAINTLQISSACLLCKPFASVWAAAGCNIDSATGTTSPGLEPRQRRTWCKPAMEFQAVEIGGQAFQNVDGIVEMLMQHEDGLKTRFLLPDLSRAADVADVEGVLQSIGEVLLDLASAFQQQVRVEEAMEVSSGVLALSRCVKVCLLWFSRAIMLSPYAPNPGA